MARFIISKPEQGEKIISLMEMIAHREGLIRPVEILEFTKYLQDDKTRYWMERFAVELAKGRCSDPKAWYKEYCDLVYSGKYKPID